MQMNSGRYFIVACLVFVNVVIVVSCRGLKGVHFLREESQLPLRL